MSGMNESLLQGLGMMHKSITAQCSVLQDQMRQSRSASKEHHLSNAQPCDGKVSKEFGTWLDDVSRLAAISGKDQAVVAMAISRGPYISTLMSYTLVALYGHPSSPSYKKDSQSVVAQQ